MRFTKMLACLLVAAVLVQACSRETTTSLRLGTNVWIGYEPLYLARDLGFYQANDLRLIEYPSASEVIRAFRNRAIEAASLTLDEVLLLRAHNVPVTVVLVHDISNGADVIMVKPGISSVSQLKGKRVGVEASALGAYVLSRALDINQLRLSDIKVVNIDINKHVRAYRQGKVDAVVTFEPSRTQLLALGASQIFSSKQIPDEVVDVLVVHNDYLKAHPQKVRRLIKGWFRALAYIRSNPQAAFIKMSERLKISAKQTRMSMSGIKLPNIAENKLLLGKGKRSLNHSLKRLVEVMKAKRLLSVNPDVKNIVTNQFISNAKK